MVNQQQYSNQVRLLISLIGFVNQEKKFALKGGTAINLFVRDFPRLSVDIDLVYLPITTREAALIDCHTCLTRIGSDIQNRLPHIKVVESFQQKEDALRLIVSQNQAQVKIELSPVLRGVVYPIESRKVHFKVEENFGFAEMNVVSFADLYAGKICAALDRQHPRDLFDVKLLLENEGFTENIRKAFIVYLICHARPMHEILQPNLKPLDQIFANEFIGLAFHDVTLEDLKNARIKLIELVNLDMTKNEKLFLLSLFDNKPQWHLLDLEKINELPAVQWKLQNIGQMSETKRQSEISKLKKVLKIN